MCEAGAAATVGANVGGMCLTVRWGCVGFFFVACSSGGDAGTGDAGRDAAMEADVAAIPDTGPPEDAGVPSDAADAGSDASDAGDGAVVPEGGCGDMVWPSPACASCTDQNCCSLESICSGIDACAPLNACWNGCAGDAGCTNNCATQYEGAISNFNAVLNCQFNSCRTACSGM